MQSARKVYTVSRLNQEVQQQLERSFGLLWLQGELSNFARPGSGHFYFTLKDSQSQIRCAMFKGRNRYVDFQPENGDSVLVRGKLGLYAARGDFQLIVEQMEPAGTGKLQAAFEATKRELAERGWFAQESKQALPAAPATIGVVTSPTGAALRDVLQVLRRRYRQASIVLYPTMTQGARAAPTICHALDRASERQECDVLLLVRGGGSLEDLWGFNEVAVAEAIRRCRIPVVCGVGHEVDITISDLVADLRAPTPSAAAELATPDGTQLVSRVRDAHTRLVTAERKLRLQAQHRLAMLDERLQLRHPERRMQEQLQRADELTARLNRAWQVRLLAAQNRHQASIARLDAHSPARALAAWRQRLNQSNDHLAGVMHSGLARQRARLDLLTRTLNAVGPLAVLDRGYAVVQSGGTVLDSIQYARVGATIEVILRDGELDAAVTEVRPAMPAD